MEVEESHFRAIIKPLIQGRVIPFLGAGVNLCGRPQDVPWERGRYLPSGGELTDHLAGNFGFPEGEARDLLRVSQYIAVRLGEAPLYNELHDLFDADYPINPLHRFLARLPGLVREKGYPPRYQLIVTTNYDDVLERAFLEVEEPFDLITYVAKGERSGFFRHRPPGGEIRLIEKANKYSGLSLDVRTIILKVHGAVERRYENGRRDNYVITEDHYIDYMIHPIDILARLPIPLPEKLKESHFLFLGYGLRDWNLRVLLRRIWKNQEEEERGYNSWAIERSKRPIDELFWKKHRVEIINARLEEYIAALGERLEALQWAGVAS